MVFISNFLCEGAVFYIMPIDGWVTPSTSISLQDIPKEDPVKPKKKYLLACLVLDTLNITQGKKKKELITRPNVFDKYAPYTAALKAKQEKGFFSCS